MNARACAPSDAPRLWETIDWNKAAVYVKKLQMRIAKAQKEGRYGKVQALQWMLTHSFYAKAMAVKRVTTNKGKKTSGVDHVLWSSKKAKFEAIATLTRRGYQPLPLRRMYIEKSKGKMRPLGIPTMRDRAMQTLYKMALEPVAETTADPNSYGFRVGRCTQDAAEQCFTALARKDRAQWILEGDIKGCFDNISHEWIEAHIPMDKTILHKFLKCGYIETEKLFPTENGTPQGGSISPTICNMVLDGLEHILKRNFHRREHKGTIYNPKVNFIRYADDFIVTGDSKEILEERVKPLIEEFLSERGLTLSQEKTIITHITDGFDFLGFNVRKYGGKLLIKPSKANVAKFLKKVRGIIKRNKASEQRVLIMKLNPVIRGWVNYHAHNASKRTFSAVDHQIWLCLRKWAKRRHPGKKMQWVYDRYFHHVGDRNWVFAVSYGDKNSYDPNDYMMLELASSREIKRFTKIRSNANPFDPTQQQYFEERETTKMKTSLTGRSKLLYLFLTQKGLCPVCNGRMTVETGATVHSVRCGKMRTRTMVHPYCHDQLHAEEPVFEPAL